MEGGGSVERLAIYRDNGWCCKLVAVEGVAGDGFRRRPSSASQSQGARNDTLLALSSLSALPFFLCMTKDSKDIHIDITIKTCRTTISRP